jgi:diguanylate cyclase (GGDEF)-like protein
LSGTVIATGKSYLVADYLEEQDFEGEHFGHEDKVRSLVACPFSVGNKVIGMLSAQSYKPAAYDQEDLEMLQLLAAQAGVAIENARLLVRMEHMANTDGLTGLKNRRAFDTALTEEVARAARYAYPLGLMVLDIDDFKQFNDRFGHSKGDRHLITIASYIINSVRETDVVARIGGEEFSVILPHTSRDGAIEMAERVRKNIEAAFESKISAGGTVSIGVAEYPRDGDNPADLFDAADLVMFRIKRSGKNQVGIPLEEDVR